MTDEEVQNEFDSAYLERRDLTAKAECLRHRLRTYGRAFLEISDNPFDEESRRTADRATDLSKDWADLKRVLERVSELNRFLDLKDRLEP